MEYYLIIVSMIAIIDQCNGSKSVVKRVIDGVPLNGRPSIYKAIRYYGAIASGHNFIWNYIASWDFVKPTSVICAGTLLTPGIFQTACHCLAYFDNDDKGFLKPPKVEHNWESKNIIYVGLSKQEEFDDSAYIITTKYLVHQKCAKLGKEGEAYTYDYAIARMDDTWIKKSDDADAPTFPWIEIEWAPQYTARSIRRFHFLAQAYELVCMIVGYGTHVHLETYEFSDVLRVGWANLMSHDDCWFRTGRFLYFDGKTRPSDTFIKQHFNWVCTRPFPKHHQAAGSGDSGSPLTCDNRYIGLISGGAWKLDFYGHPVEVVNKIHAIYNTVYTNAIDWRNFLIHTIDDVEIYRTRRRITEDDGVNLLQLVLPYSISR